MTEKLEKLKQGYANLSEWLEHIMAAIVLIAIVIAICSLWAPFKEFLQTRSESGPFLNIWQAYLISLSVLSFSNSYANPGRIRCSKFSCS